MNTHTFQLMYYNIDDNVIYMCLDIYAEIETLVSSWGRLHQPYYPHKKMEV